MMLTAGVGQCQCQCQHQHTGWGRGRGKGGDALPHICWPIMTVHEVSMAHMWDGEELNEVLDVAAAHAGNGRLTELCVDVIQVACCVRALSVASIGVLLGPPIQE